MKDQKMFMVFADGRVEEILMYNKGEIDYTYPIAITKSGIYVKVPMTGSWAKIDGPMCVTLEALSSEYMRPNYQGTAEFSFHPANVAAILKADNVTEVE